MIQQPWQIRQMTNRDTQFYPTLGPFLARRSIVHEMGGPLWDDDGMIWFVAVEQEQVIGFATIATKHIGKLTVIEIDNGYVMPEWRRQGVYTTLLHACLAACPNDVLIRATVSTQSHQIFLREGFAVRRLRGASWTEVERVKAS